MPILRISQGSFKSEDYESIKARLDEAEQTRRNYIQLL
jgi:hypothetical protein